MPLIYVITNKATWKQYVGQTVLTIEERFKAHKHSCEHYKRYLENPEKYKYKGTSTYLYKSMIKHGYDKFIIETIEEVDEDMLDKKEEEYIDEFGTMAPNGYNLVTGGGHFRHCDETKKIISEKVKDTMVNNIDNFRTSDKTKGLPAYIAYKSDGDYEAYYVNNHPLCPTNKYFSAFAYGSIDIAKQKCAEFVDNLNETQQTHIAEGPNGAPIKGLRTLEYGYQVRKTIKGIVREKSFNDKSLTKEENLQNAYDYINSLKETK